MAFPLPRLSLAGFAAELVPLSPEPLGEPAVAALFAYY